MRRNILRGTLSGYPLLPTPSLYFPLFISVAEPLRKIENGLFPYLDGMWSSGWNWVLRGNLVPRAFLRRGARLLLGGEKLWERGTPEEDCFCRLTFQHPLRMLKRQSPPIVLLRTHFTRTIKFHPSMSRCDTPFVGHKFTHAVLLRHMINNFTPCRRAGKLSQRCYPYK